jgi:threonine/homoserine/homoserine lactone efflux protein
MKWIHKYSFTNKAFLLGFLISFIGSLPLGYLNIICLQILVAQGHLAIISFILGVTAVEFFVLKVVSFGAKWLVKQKKLLLAIDIFTILFFTSIALFFISNNDETFVLSQLEYATYPFLLGLLLNGLNVIQWPYWSGIYIYVYRNNKLKTTKKANYLFIVGALIGTGIGMLLFAYLGQYILVENNIEISNYLNLVFAILFFILASIQITKLVINQNKKVKKTSNKN